MEDSFNDWGPGLGGSPLSVDDSKFVVRSGVAMLKLCSGFEHGSILAACSEDAYIPSNVANALEAQLV
ncbi:hypothetical protein GJ744_006528 [Endocarpon pusillum]|uniref:Uncharacterized protein n=1 Tax=Endocarpon pusillum TaxID=364733 RepID=A0A8H7AT66_9EURO|nr:hypothetical protein GJ744_006528 [Endocarpon pusillum]